MIKVYNILIVSKLKIEILEVATKTQKWPFYKLERFLKKPKSVYIKRLKLPDLENIKSKLLWEYGLNIYSKEKGSPIPEEECISK